MLIELFINAGWHTVPLKGKLERLPGDKKTLAEFEYEWKKKYAKTFNTSIVPLAGTLTGKISGIIAVDCDNQLTYDLFRSMDPTYNFLFVSKGKEAGGGTIIYKYTDEVGTFSLKTDELKLDFYSDEGFVFLPTEDNNTKESWAGVTKLPELHEAPAAVIAMLKAFKAKVPASGVTANNEVKRVISNRLAPMLVEFTRRKAYEPGLFKVLTPYSFRDLPSYITKGHLHPNDVPNGRGSEYLSKVSAIIGSDISVDKELYTNTMMLINNFWDDPMEKGKLLTTIINPMIEERATIDGQVIWQYDPYWEKMGFIATSLNGDYLESFFDDVKGIYFLINYTVPYIKTFSDKRPLLTTVKTLLGRNVTEQQYDSTKQLTRTYLNPAMEFGHIKGTDTFNLFRQTEALNVLNNPKPYAPSYVYPKTIIKYFESLIPDDYMRSYVLSFIKTKLSTFDYSPVVLYLLGKPGSGKDTLISILSAILGRDYIAKPDTKVFLEQYNGWLMDKYIVQLDEYGNKLYKSSDREEALGKIKAYTGSSEIQIRAMRNDGFNYKHSATFIMTANSNPLPIENEDRRFALIRTPNKLATQDWVQEAGGIRHVVERLIPAEIIDFCYYLATEVKTLNGTDYVIAPLTEDKERIILENMPAAEQIIYYVQNNKFEELIDLSIEYGVANFTEGWDKNRLLDAKLAELYDSMTEGQGRNLVLIKAMKGIGHSRSHTTRLGSNEFYYYIGDLYKYSNIKSDEPLFEPQFNDKQAIAGLE